MKYGNLYKFLVIMGVAIVLLSLSIRFFKKNTSNERIPIEHTSTLESETDIISVETPEDTTPAYTYSDNAAGEEEIQKEQYSPWEDTGTTCYFTNTEKTIDVGNILPVNAQGQLVEDTQNYLNREKINAKELRCIDGSVMTEGAVTSFRVQCDDKKHTIITMTYDRDLHTWAFKQK